jgi:hypothetical protein
MFKLLFASRWFALLWVAGTLASVSLFVGEDGAVDKLGESVQQVAAEQREPADLASAEPEPESDEPIGPPAFDIGQSEPEGEVFINSETGQKIRIVRREVSADYAPEMPEQ